jgi:hypothetical protein
MVSFMRRRESANRSSWLKIMLLLAAVGLLAAACGPAEDETAEPQPLPEVASTPTPPDLSGNQGAIVGQIVVAGDPPPAGTLVYLASFYRHQEGWGFFMMEPNLAVHVPVDEAGYFQAYAIKPGEYVLVVGPSAEEGVVILGDDGEPLIIEVAAEQVVDVGRQLADLSAAPALSPIEPPSGYPPPVRPTLESAYP